MITIKNITKQFNDNVIFKDFACEIEENDLVAITGASGCGKTTLLNILGLLDSDYDGDVFYDKCNIKDLKEAKKSKFIRENINYLFQNFALIDDSSVEENLMLALFYVKKKKENKQKMIRNVLKKLKLDQLLHKKVYQLSGGEQQRIALARVMLKPGDIILADEPTGNLDENNKDIVMDELIELHKQGKTVIIVTHDKNIVSKCNHVIKIGL